MISDIASRVLGILSSHRKWTKGNMHAAGGRHCVAGAAELLGIANDELYRFHEAFFDTAIAQYPELGLRKSDCSRGETSRQQVISVNDHVHMRYRDIRRILEKLAARED